MKHEKIIYLDYSNKIENSAMSQCVSYTLASTVEYLIKKISSLNPGIQRIFSNQEYIDFIFKFFESKKIKIKSL